MTLLPPVTQYEDTLYRRHEEPERQRFGDQSDWIRDTTRIFQMWHVGVRLVAHRLHAPRLALRETRTVGKLMLFVSARTVVLSTTNAQTCETDRS